MTEQLKGNSSFDPRRGLIIAVSITAFMLIFRPFGLAVNTPAALFILLGLAPLNFMMILLVHMAPRLGGWLGAVQGFASITLANIAYITLLTNERSGVVTSVKVMLVALLVIAAISLWNRERSLKREVVELRSKPDANEKSTPIVLHGEGEKEILRLEPQSLRFVKANANYADINFLKNGAPEEVMLRATLTGIMDQAPPGMLTRCHRSYIVNIAAACRLVTASGRMEIEFEDGTRIPVSRSYRLAVKQAALD